MPAIPTNRALFDAISELKVVDAIALENALTEADKKKVSLGDILLDHDLITEDNLGKIMGDLTSLPYINLSEILIADNVLHLIPKEVAKAQGVIAFKRDDLKLSVATNNPDNKIFFDLLSKKTGTAVSIYYTFRSGIEKTLPLYEKDVVKAFDDILSENIKDAKDNKNYEPPITKIVDTIIAYAYQSRASDIHMEPLEDATLVRFRVDGILSDIVSLPKNLDAQIVTRIKIMANLRTDEHQEAQDGKIVQKIDNENLDIRVSIAPIVRGEKVVMRLLAEKTRHFSLADLGLLDDGLKKITEAYKAPHGMILSTGPTGSGKTTTLYSILKLINKRSVNIMTIEDPVEYQIDNINQIQVNPKTDLTFAKGLRSIVRQDPDVILVGEIRDEETAGIAINSAMTGHLVLSTLHTNDAATTFPRLIDMKVEPYLVASTVNVVVAQRLVRKICPKCRVSFEADLSTFDPLLAKYFGKVKKITLYKGKGCPICRQSGYVGRIGIFEVMYMTEELGAAVVAKKSSDEIQKIAVSSGMRTMLEDGILKVKQGTTTLEEILRVVRE